MTSSREAALERDDYRCRLCGGMWGVQVHHIKYRSSGGPDDLLNLITLCHTCHTLEHEHKIRLHFEVIDNNLEVFLERTTHE